MDELVRYSVQWYGPAQPICLPMPDGYWTSWHVATAKIDDMRAERDRLRTQLAEVIARAERAEANAANWEEQANDRVSDWDEVRAERDALKLRLAAVEDMNAACNADFSRLRAELAALRAQFDAAEKARCHAVMLNGDYTEELAALRVELQKVRSAAISGMDAATQHGRGLVQQAAKLRAESNPDALESERAANALLTEQLEKAETEAARLQAAIEQAPHDKHCVYFEISPANDCDCWKRAALGER